MGKISAIIGSLILLLAAIGSTGYFSRSKVVTVKKDVSEMSKETVANCGIGGI